MRHASPLLLALAVLLLAAAPSLAATEVRMSGDARIYGLFFANRNFTGYSVDGTQAEERFEIWQRFRLRGDFVANENLKFRFGLRVNDENWGHGTLTAANPQVAIEPYLAYLQFLWPNTNVEITAGYQPVSAPHTEVFYNSIVLGGDDGDQSSAALFLKIPVIEDRLAVEAAYARLFAANQTYQATNAQDITLKAGNFDIYRLAVPITPEGFDITPWGLAGVYGKNVGQTDAYGDLFGANLGSAASVAGGYRNTQNTMWWTGLAATVTALEPWKLYFDAIYGSAAPGDRAQNRRQGYFLDAGLTYTGFDWAVPGLFGWLASGEDSSLGNGSERLPVILPKWGAATSFLFDCDQDFSGNNMGIDPTGTWGVMAALREISLVESLKSRLSVGVVVGTNSRAGLRKAFEAAGTGYVSMGRTLAQGEWALGVSFDHSYELYENLTLNLQTGFASPQGLKTSVWGHEATSRAKDAWMGALGMLYTF